MLIISPAPYYNWIQDKKLKESGIRTYLDESSESVSKKIKLGRRLRPSYFLILGEREKENCVSILRGATRRNKLIEVRCI